MREVLALLLLSACVVKVDAEPVIADVILIGVAADTVVRPGTVVRARLEGEELWNRTAAVEIHRISAKGDVVEDEVPARFDAGEDRQTATAEWTVGGGFLLEGGRSEIYLVARFGGVSARSSSFFVDVNPKLERVTLAGLSEGDRVEPRSTIRAEVSGTDVASLPVLLELRWAGATSGIAVTATVAFDGSQPVQKAAADVVVDGAFVERAGRYDLHVRAALGAREATSPAVHVDVVTAVNGVELRNFGNLAFPGEVIVFPGSLSAAVEGTGLVDQAVLVELYRGAPDVLLSSATHVATSNRFDLPFAVDPSIYGAGEDSVSIYLRASAAGTSARSSAVPIDRVGIARCGWTRGGQYLAESAEAEAGSIVDLLAETWGFSGDPVAFDVYESDSTSGDDLVGRIDGSVVASDRATTSWTVEWMDDGVLSNTAEYHFIARIGTRTCQSGQIDVPRP